MDKNAIFRVRISSEKLLVARSKAELLGISFSQYIRDLIRDDFDICSVETGSIITEGYMTVPKSDKKEIKDVSVNKRRSLWRR